MILKEIEKIEKVSNFEPSKYGFFLWRDGKVYLNEILIYDKQPNAVYFYKGAFFIVKSNWEDSIYINTISSFKKELLGISGMNKFIDVKSILRNVWNDEYTESKRLKINLETGNTVWETQIGYTYIEDELFFGMLENKICRVKPNTGQPMWESDILQRYGTYSINNEEHEMDIQKYIGIYEDCLYFKAGNKLILGVDVNTAKERFSYENNNEYILLDNLCLDNKNGVIFSIGRIDYFELNLKTGIAEITSLEDTVQEFKVETTRLGSWENNIIYFWEGRSNANFGLFDRNTKKIIKAQNLNVSAYPAIRDLKHRNGNIYVLDGNNTLHIFEEEKMKNHNS